MFSNNSGSNNNNPPILFLHGFMGSQKDWKVLLEDPNCPANSTAIDIPGHGDLSAKDVNTEAAFQHILDNLPDSNRLGVHLVGYSLGGRLALQFALSYPQFIHKLTLISAHPGLATDAEREKRLQADEKRSETLLATWPDFVSNWYKEPMWGKLSESNNYAQLLQSRQNNDASPMAKAVVAYSLAHQKTLPKLKTHCPFPILWITGELDKVYTQEISKLSETCTNITHKIIENAGHACHVEFPEKIQKLILE